MADQEEQTVTEKRNRTEDSEDQTEEPPTKLAKTSENGEASTSEGVELSKEAPVEEKVVESATVQDPTLATTDENGHTQPDEKAEDIDRKSKAQEQPSEDVSNANPVSETVTLETLPSQGLTPVHTVTSEATASETPAPNPTATAELSNSDNAVTAPAPVSDPTSSTVTIPSSSAAPVPTQAPALSNAAPAATTQIPGLPPGFSTAQDPNPDAIVEERGSVSALYVGRVIGKGGEMIRDLQARSSCRIDVDQDVPPGQPRVITYRGTRRTVDFAKRLVQMLCQDNASEMDLPLGDAKREFLIVPAQSVGKIIGRGGEMIRELQTRSQAKIQVDHNAHNGMEHQKHVTITGSELAVAKAKEMILFLVANPLMDAMQSINMLVEDKVHRGGVWGSGPPYPNLPNMGQNMEPNGGGGYGYDQQQYYGGGRHGGPSGYGAQMQTQPYAAPSPYGGAPPVYQQNSYGQPNYDQYRAGGGGIEMEIFYAAKNFMGRVIGQKGVTINDLQRQSGCDIQINQDVPPGRDCEISIRGTRQGIEIAKKMLKEIIEIGPNHPYAGGAPSHSAGGYQQGGYGQSAPQYGMQQGGYHQAPVYGGQQSYNQGYQAPPAMYSQSPAVGYQQTPPMYSAPPGAAPPMFEWKSATAPDGQVYYYNERTGATQWEKPPGMP